MSPSQNANRTRPGSTRFQAHNPGAVRLSKEADTQIAERTPEIIKALIESTCAGNATSARLLVSLAEGVDWTANAKDAHRILTLAGDWATEPEWPGPPRPDSAVETIPAESVPPPANDR